MPYKAGITGESLYALIMLNILTTVGFILYSPYLANSNTGACLAASYRLSFIGLYPHLSRINILFVCQLLYLLFLLEAPEARNSNNYSLRSHSASCLLLWLHFTIHKTWSRVTHMERQPMSFPRCE
jgi:hypothetical protein